MKQLILAFVGSLICIYVLVIALNCYSISVRLNQIESNVSPIIKRNLQEGYRNLSNEEVQNRIKEELLLKFQKRNISFDFQEVDMERGIISLRMKEQFTLLSGKEKRIEWEKTILLDLHDEKPEMVNVRFFYNEKLYKEYRIEKGNSLFLPACSGGKFQGWKVNSVQSKDSYLFSGSKYGPIDTNMDFYGRGEELIAE